MRSLILVTVDCFRADHAGFLGYQRATTPFLDVLAGEGCTFTNAIVAGVPTYYSFPAILAGRYPLALGRDVIGLAADEPTLASVLRNAGYATACFNAANPYLSRRFGYGQGFDVFRDFLEEDTGASTKSQGSDAAPQVFRSQVNRWLARVASNAGAIGALYDELYFQYCQRIAAPRPASLDVLRRFPAADAIVDEACRWLTSHAHGPVFLWLHLMDPHAPYYPAEGAAELLGLRPWSSFRARYVNETWNRGDLSPRRLLRFRDEVVELYDGGIRWVDLQLSRLTQCLRQLGLWEDSTLAFTADHGEEFLDHGGRFHAPTKLTEELIRVPLLLRARGMQGRRIDSAFSLLDLAPTLLESLSIDSADCVQGKSRWPNIARGERWDEPVTVECVSGCTNPFLAGERMRPRLLAVRDTRFKLVVECGSGRSLLFDLEQDPLERTALPADAERSTQRRFLEIAGAQVESSLRSQPPERRLRARVAELRSSLLGANSEFVREAVAEQVRA